MANYRLISFNLCPFVQRSVIVLNQKNIAYDIEYIDLMNKPEWFLKISPLGKVPVLQVGNEVLFESAIIMEYLDEVNPPSLHPTNPLQKAKARAWIEFSSHLLGLQYQWTHAKTQVDSEAKMAALSDGLQKFAAEAKGPWFAGEDMQLVDVATAPLFTRFNWIQTQIPDDLFGKNSFLREYAKLIDSTDSIRRSVLPEVPELYRQYIKKSGAFMAQWF